MNTESLKFDNMVINTTLAEMFLDSHPDLKDPTINEYTRKNIFQLGTLHDSQAKLSLLASLVKENKDIFCQLEYLIRGRPIKEVEDYDLKLLVNNLLYHANCCMSRDAEEKLRTPFLIMGEDTPLANLGFILEILNKFNEPIIESSKKTAAICTLFVELCHEVGFSTVSLHIVSVDKNEDDYQFLHLENVKELQNGCTGIITKRSDIDSAVDIFLHAPTTYPWAVRNIYVEESAMERFTQTINWKASSTHDLLNNFFPFCTNAYYYDGNLFLYEYVGNNLSEKHVLIHSYRTVKDLLSIIETSLSVSLWSSDVAESIEISNNLKSNIIWINDFGNFNGTPRTSQSFYSVLKLHQGEFKTKVTPEIQKLRKLHMDWLKIDICKRRELILSLLKWKNENFHIELDDFVDFGKTFMCVGRMLPTEMMYNYNDSLDCTDVMGLVIRGSSVIWYSKIKRSSEMYDHFIKVGAPVLFLDKELESSTSSHPGEDVTLYKYVAYKTKVVWTSFGTIFAN